MFEYEKYTTILTKKEYFDRWKPTEIEQITEKVQNAIYNKYRVKAEMMQRDNFKCQNVNCKTPTSRLTMHHVKWQKNGGIDKVRNVVTVCKACHAGFHRAKCVITFSGNVALPTHIRGKTFQLKVPDATRDWKKLRVEMKALRNRLKQSGMVSVVSWEDVYILMEWLFGYNDESIDDD